MTTSTTMLYGTDCVIEAELGTSTVDLSGSSNSANVNLDMIIGEANVFNDKWPQRVMTAKNCTIDLAAWYSSAQNEAADYFQDWFNEATPAPKEISIYIPSKTAGATKINAHWVFNGLKIGLKSAETQPIPITMQLLNAGTVTIAPYSTQKAGDMAIPEKPLEVTADLQSLTIGELKVFSKKGFDFYEFRQFMIDHTNWTEAEIDGITLAEMEQVAVQLGEALKKQAVPLPN